MLKEGQSSLNNSLQMLNHDIDMLTMVIIGNSMTFIKMEKWFTKRL